MLTIRHSSTLSASSLKMTMADECHSSAIVIIIVIIIVNAYDAMLQMHNLCKVAGPL